MSVALLPYAASVALVSATFAILSSHVTKRELSEASIAQLMRIEEQIPEWATLAGQFAPPWLAVSVGALGFAIAVLTIKAQIEMIVAPKLHRVAKWYATGMQWIGALLGAACCFTLFGDGIRDQIQEIRREIHEVRLRLVATQDMVVQELAQEVAREAVAREMQNADDDARALMLHQAAFVRQMVEIEGLVTLAREKRRIQPEQVLIVLARLSWQPNPTPTEPGTPSPSSSFRWKPPNSEQFPRARMSFANDRSATGMADEQQDVSKEFIAYGLAATKDVVASDPAMGFFFDILAAAVAETLKSIATQTILEPALNRIWATAASGDRYAAARLEARELVSRVAQGRGATTATWNRSASDRERSRALADQYRDAVKALQSESLAAVPSPLDAERRTELLKTLERMGLERVASTVAASYADSEAKGATLTVLREFVLVERCALDILTLRAMSDRGASVVQEHFYHQLEGRLSGPAVRRTIPMTLFERALEDRLLGGKIGVEGSEAPDPKRPKPSKF